jgi:hypothetical protein
MAETRVHGLSFLMWLLTVGLGVVLVVGADASPLFIAVGAGAITIGQLISVPAPSGERHFLGIAAAVAVPLLAPDARTALVVFAFGMAGSWVVFAFRDRERRLLSSQFISELVAVWGFAAAYYGTIEIIDASAPVGDGPRLAAIAAGGLAWFVARAFMRSLVGLDRDDLSVRYLWLLALSDWSVVVSLLTAGALFGFAWPNMRWWALPVAGLPYAFSHLAFVRYNDTRITYGQTIRALAQIPEVAGLAPNGHSARTASLAIAVAQDIGMEPAEVAELEYAALMHDIGRITLNEPAILRAGYTDEDIARWGAQIIAEAPYLHRVAELVSDQHRPFRKAGQERDETVALASKVIKVASAFDKAQHDMGLPAVDALEQLHRGSAYEFDPEIVAALRRTLTHRGLLPANR